MICPRSYSTLLASLFLLAPALVPAQERAPAGTTTAAAPTDSLAEARAARDSSAAAARALLSRTNELQNIRHADKRGLNVFEAPKFDGTPFTGIKLVWGGSFTQQFQGLGHRNAATPRMVAGVNANQLINLGHGFNNAGANIDLGVQLAPGIRVALTTYASSRHHPETWVKEGYVLIDESPIRSDLLEGIMQFVTLRAGHFEINYGDQHFRRTDNGNAIYNPFVGNLLMDAFTTEIGAEVYLRLGGLMAMGGMTAGEIKGQVAVPEKRSPSYLGKVGYDRQVDSSLRVRLTGSLYKTARSANNTLYSGSRAGSRYFSVVENTTSTEAAQAWSGDARPGMTDNVTAMVLNPFVKFKGLELFGNIEQATGKAASEKANRRWRQYAGEAVYRFLPRETMYVGSRYNVARGDLAGMTSTVSLNRTQLAAGWFITPSLLAKAEWVSQSYNDFPSADIRNGGRFSGFMFEGVVAF